MSYISASNSETSLTGPGCGPGCNCGPCKSGGVGEWYVREKPAGLSEGFGETRPPRTSMSQEEMRRFRRQRYQNYKKACAGIRVRPSRHGFEYGRLGYIGEKVRALKLSPPYLVFHSIRHFDHNSPGINDRVRDQIRGLVKLVEMSWNTDKPIVEMRLVGHTDSTGSQTYNVTLGEARAKALQKELSQIKGVGDRVLVLVGPSPGKTKPVGNNGTAFGRSQNRRVDVFVTFGERPLAPPPPPPPPPKPCIDPRKCVTEVPRGSVIITRPDQIGPTIPPPPKGKSIEQLINEKLSRLPRWLSWAIRKAIIEGSCMALETALGKVVGELSESEKDELRRQCSERAKKPL